MASLADLRTAIANLLGLPGSAAILQLNANTRERAFEGYLFGLVLQAVRQAGGAVELRGINSGASPNPVILRGGPGHLGSRDQDFCYAKCTLNGHEFEVHVGVIYVGTSGASHEIDVSAYDHDAATKVRGTRRMLPTTRKLLAAIECKFYDSTLGTVLGRTFVGLVGDCGRLLVSGFASNGQNGALATYLSKPGRPEPFFRLSPLVPAHGDRFVSYVEQRLRQWARVS